MRFVLTSSIFTLLRFSPLFLFLRFLLSIIGRLAKFAAFLLAVRLPTHPGTRNHGLAGKHGHLGAYRYNDTRPTLCGRWPRRRCTLEQCQKSAVYVARKAAQPITSCAFMLIFPLGTTLLATCTASPSTKVCLHSEECQTGRRGPLRAGRDLVLYASAGH